MRLHRHRPGRLQPQVSILTQLYKPSRLLVEGDGFVGGKLLSIPRAKQTSAATGETDGDEAVILQEVGGGDACYVGIKSSFILTICQIVSATE